MESKKRLIKNTSIVVVALLMLFSIVLFTACKPNDPPETTYTKENVISILNNLVNFNGTTSNVEVKSTGMTEYKGINGWELNSVDFNLCSDSNYYSNVQDLKTCAKLMKNLLSSDVIGVNDSYVKVVNYLDPRHPEEIKVKLEITDNQLFIYHIGKSGGNLIGGIVVAMFNNDYSIKNIVANFYDVYGCLYFANSQLYECIVSNMTEEFQAGFKASELAERSKSTKNTAPVDITEIMREIQVG